MLEAGTSRTAFFEADTPSYVEWRMDAFDICGSVLLVRPDSISAEVANVRSFSHLFPRT